MARETRPAELPHPASLPQRPLHVLGRSAARASGPGSARFHSPDGTGAGIARMDAGCSPIKDQLTFCDGILTISVSGDRPQVRPAVPAALNHPCPGAGAVYASVCYRYNIPCMKKWAAVADRFVAGSMACLLLSRGSGSKTTIRHPARKCPQGSRPFCVMR